MLKEVLTQLRRALRRHRRLLAAVLAADDLGLPVLVAARDVPAGAALRPGDLRLLTLPEAAIPQDALTLTEQAVGRTVVAHLPARAVLTASHLTSSGSLVAAGRVALPVTLSDTAPVGLLRAGDTIDLLGVAARGVVEVLASSVRVVTIPAAGDSGTLGSGSEPVILVDLTPGQAARVVAAAGAGPLAFALR